MTDWCFMTENERELPDNSHIETGVDVVAHPRKRRISAQAYLLTAFFASMIIAAACSQEWAIEHYSPILGYWETERGIIMSIHKAPDGIVASVKDGKEYNVEAYQAGDALITGIVPLVDGGYKGYLVMPGPRKPVTVKMGLISRDVLIIATWDSRTKSKIMEWRRVRPPK